MATKWQGGGSDSERGDDSDEAGGVDEAAVAMVMRWRDGQWGTGSVGGAAHLECGPGFAREGN